LLHMQQKFVMPVHGPNARPILGLESPHEPPCCPLPPHPALSPAAGGEGGRRLSEGAVQGFTVRVGSGNSPPASWCATPRPGQRKRPGDGLHQAIQN
jgi:hypothetical protein